MKRVAHGKHRSRIRRRRRTLVGVAAAAAIVAAVVLLQRDDGVERVCGRPDELRTRGNVTLTAEAMDAFITAETAAGQPIVVVQSYRSCRQQAVVCERICGSRRGCPGLCAPPGLSWHQRGQAIDVTQDMLETPGVVTALEDAGWCQAVPDSDPGHFSFNGCH